MYHHTPSMNAPDYNTTNDTNSQANVITLCISLLFLLIFKPPSENISIACKLELLSLLDKRASTSVLNIRTLHLLAYQFLKCSTLPPSSFDSKSLTDVAKKADVPILFNVTLTFCNNIT